jgi:AGCS family alanine or glycine:cation symporter
VKVYRILYVLVVIPAATLKLEIAWHLADAANGLMVIPNLIALILLKDVIQTETLKFTQEFKAIEKTY